MMKRLCALLLALALLCGTALAEDAWVAELSWESYPAGMQALAEWIMGEDGTKAKYLAESLTELLDGLKIDVRAQEGGAYLGLSLKDTLLVDMTSISDWQEAKILSNLMPGHCIHATISPEDAAANQAAYEKLLALDTDAFANEITAVMTAWLDALPAAEEKGYFMGDAYDGGMRRVTRSFDDALVAQLVDKLIDTANAWGIDDALMSAYLGVDGTFGVLKGWNNELAKENRFAYVLHNVYGIDGSYVGSSLVVQEGGAQVMTLSHGVAANGHRLVWGYGLNGVNYYLEADLLQVEEEELKEFSLMLLEDTAHLGFRSVEQMDEAVRFWISGTAGQRDGAPYADVELLNPGAPVALTRYVLEGDVQPDVSEHSLTMQAYLGNEDYVTLGKLWLATAQCDPVTWQTDGLTAIDADSAEDAQVLDELIEESVQEMALTLFKLIPAPLLTMFIF